MKIEFKTDSALNKEDIEVEIKAAQKSEVVDNLIDYLHKFGEKKYHLLPIKVEDRIVTIKPTEIIKVEIQTTDITFYTTKDIIKTTGRLYQVLEKLGDGFIQVSKHGIININFLESIEVGFEGNMIALLKNNLKADVSRLYLPALKKELGL
ncbi:LytTR family transcriptional regulator [Lactobacillus kimbladii]|uniref:LytTR family DNA-binding domain-containing protein n=1 Tax=Lactobacillus TaxID=1578 RepID=UPI000EFBAAF7|nr:MULTISPECIES: LytTR family DNA-binding domain-containing protein [Lactobacillus]MBC6341588.1 LytTR family transcriptional regulator [Lactobacillus kimbladii]RMC53499.1 LytTR family transcriptional regulator [Lactobacillus sp. ESL0261]